MLNQLLEKLNLKYENLTAEERKTYQEWAKVLMTTDVTIDGLKQFLAVEYDRATEELQKWDNSLQREQYYKALTRFTSMMLKFIATPAAQRDALKNHLREVFHIDV